MEFEYPLPWPEGQSRSPLAEVRLAIVGTGRTQPAARRCAPLRASRRAEL